MKLLVVTQVIDSQHPILGFFSRWITEFCNQGNAVTAIGQSVHFSNVPRVQQGSLSILSLGKERGLPVVVQIVVFWWHIIRSVSSYDAVFIHMTPIWVILGAPVWLLSRKPVFLWYEARGRGWNVRLALPFVRKVFSASAHGVPLEASASVVVGHGIDTEHFQSRTAKNSTNMISVGRITSSKNIPLLLACMEILSQEYTLQLVGIAITPADKALLAQISDRISRPPLVGRVTIRQASQQELPTILSSSGLFLHAAETSLDKAVLEAMACELPVISCSAAVQDILPSQCRSVPSTFVSVVTAFLTHPEPERHALGKQLRSYIVERHDLKRLICRLTDEMVVS